MTNHSNARRGGRRNPSGAPGRASSRSSRDSARTTPRGHGDGVGDGHGDGVNAGGNSAGGDNPKAGSKPGAKSRPKAGSRAGARAAGSSRGRSDGRPDGRPGGRSGGKPGSKSGLKSGGRSSGKPGSKSGNKPGGKSGLKAGVSAYKRRQRRRPDTRPRRGSTLHRDTSRMTTQDETSAGGLVVSGLAEAVREDGSVDLSRIYVALIGRLDRRGRLLWSMPKGHVEEGEPKDLTAEREVWEETGITGEVFAELGVIDYWFVSEGIRIHKTVHHHLLRYVDGILNDEDPEVTEVSWIPVSQLIEHLAYADERKLARIAHDLLPDLARKEAAAGKATPR